MNFFDRARLRLARALMPPRLALVASPSRSIATADQADHALVQVDTGIVENARSGMGRSSRDRSVHTELAQVPALDRDTLERMFRKSVLARRIVSKRAAVAISKGVRLSVQRGDAAWLQQELRRLDVLPQGLDGRTWGNLFGGALVCLTIEGHDPATPLRPTDAIRRIVRLSVYDRWEVSSTLYGDGSVSVDQTGLPTSYRVTVPNGAQITYHASRVWRFDGAPVTSRVKRSQSGWCDSVLVSPYPSMLRVWTAAQSLGSMLGDSSVGVWKIKGFNQWLENGNGAAIQEWLDTQILYRGLLGDHAIDGDDSFEFKGRPMDEAIEVFKALLLDLATEVDMPHTELFGISPSGLNASGESDRRKWHESIESYERPIFSRYLEWLVSLLQRQVACPRDLRAQEVLIEWPALEVQTPKEEQEAESAQVQNEVALVEAGILTTQEARARLARSWRYDLANDAANDAPPESFKPPAAVAAEAARGLALRERHQRGGTRVGVTRANQLAARESVSAETLVRMLAFFERFKGEVGKVNANGRAWGDEANPSNAWIAWLLWGGNAAWRWARSIVGRYELQASEDGAPLRPAPALLAEADALPFVFWVGFRVPEQIGSRRPALALDDSPAHVTLLTWSQRTPDPSAALDAIRARIEGSAGRMTLGEVSSWIGPDGAVIFQRVMVEHEVRLDRLRDHIADALVEMDALPNRDGNYWRPHLTLAYLDHPTALWAGDRLDGSWWGGEMEVWGRDPSGALVVLGKISLAN